MDLLHTVRGRESVSAGVSVCLPDTSVRRRHEKYRVARLPYGPFFFTLSTYITNNKRTYLIRGIIYNYEVYN